jgi:hypothetical protein
MAREIRSGRLVLRPGADPQAWDQLVTAHPDATPFHLSTFLTTAGRLLGLDVHLAVAEVDGQVVGVVPLLVRSRGPFALVNHHLPFPYLGPLVRMDHPLEELRDAVRRYLAPRTVLRASFEWRRPVAEVAGPHWLLETDYTSAFVPVAGLDDEALLARLARDPRSRYRRAVREGVVAGPAAPEEVAGHLSRWNDEVFARQGLPPRWPTEAQFELHQQLQPSGVSHATALRRDGELLGVEVSLLLNGQLIGWEMGVSEAGRRANAGVVLQVHAMRNARDLGAKELDMLGAPTEGIAHYKRGLGAEFRRRGVARWESPLVGGLRLAGRATALLPTRAAG